MDVHIEKIVKYIPLTNTPFLINQFVSPLSFLSTASSWWQVRQRCLHQVSLSFSTFISSFPLGNMWIITISIWLYGFKYSYQILIIYKQLYSFKEPLLSNNYHPLKIILFFIGQVGRMFANGPGDRGSIPGRVIPKTLKMVLDTSLLNT